MMRRTLLGFTIAIALLWSAQAWAVSVVQVPNPRAHGGWVSDTIDVLTPADEARMNGMIAAAERDLGVEIAVVTVEQVDTATPKDFATALFNHWGIGKRANDNGLLVLLVRGERRLEMETGYGTEAVLTDGWLKSMQGQRMVPHFKAGDYGTGLVAGVEASIERLRGRADGIPMGAFDDAGRDAPGDAPESDVPWWLVLLGGGTVAGLGGGAAAWKHRRDRTCTECQKRMQMLPEDDDDAYLQEGQQVEEQVGSVDYQFWFCEDCDTRRILTVGKWFSGHSTCPSCNYRTMHVTTSTLDYPTYSSTGLQEIVEDCAHCDHHRRRTRILPRKTRSTSSSSSFGGGGGGGGSFGGGSSGGGGAGSSW